MKESKFSESQIVNILKEAEAGVSVEDLSRQHGLSKASFYKWKAKYGGMSLSKVKRMKEVVRVLEQLLDWRGKPTQIRMDNGPELISQRLENWAKEKPIELLHIQPGKPAQNAYIERFNRTYRQDVLDAYLFDDLQEVRHITECWLEDHNTIRPHEALKGISPRQFALQQA